MTNSITPTTAPRLATKSRIKQKDNNQSFRKRAMTIKNAIIDLDFGQRYSQKKFEDFYASYHSNHSVLRTLGTWIILTLIPTVLTVSLMLLPVTDLKAGLTGRNWFSVLQATGFGTFAGITAMMRFRNIVEESSLTWRERYKAAAILAFTIFATFTITGRFFRYPPPFAILLCGGNGITAFMIYWVYCEISLHPEKKLTTSIKYELLQACASLGFSYGTTLIHEAVGVLYTSQAHSIVNQALVAVCLPVLKISFRFMQSWLLRKRSEGFGTMIASFEVEFFNKIYTSIFLQNTASLYIIIVLLSFDVVENTLFIFEMNSLASHCFEDGRSDGKLDQNSFTGNTLLDRKLLFRTEVVGLIEVVEVLTPLMYLTYICMIRIHPNLKYITTLRILSDEEFFGAVKNILLYSLVEFVSILGLMIPLWYRFHLPLLFQTGYAMREHKWTIVSLMSVMLFIAFTGPYVHFGNDYTFEFKSTP